ncbi:hypothetical protein BJV74DRAFT_257459 [Russula compacta]|nr:hypothetical protein BJV74DRAFT_257459 [Russula compacta]
MLLVYGFDPTTGPCVNQVARIPYCFHIALPVRTGLATSRDLRICANTASFSPPITSSLRGYFYADAKDRIITVEVTDNNWMQGMAETAELYAPVRTFLAYMAAHPPRSSSEWASARDPVVHVPWEAWGPHAAHLVRTPDQTYIIRRGRACGMRVLGAPLSKKSVVVVDYHPGRVARSASASVDRDRGGGTALAASVRSPTLSTCSEIQLGRGHEHGAIHARQHHHHRKKPLVRVTKEVPLPPELQEASESLWMMMCEDALLAFEYVPDGFEISRVFAYTF